MGNLKWAKAPEWRPVRTTMIIMGIPLFALAVMLIQQFFGLFTKLLPADAIEWVKGAVAGSLFMAVILLIGRAVDGFAAAMGALGKDDPPSAEPTIPLSAHEASLDAVARAATVRSA